MVTYRCNQLISGKPQKGAIPREVEIMCYIFPARKTQFLIVNDRQLEVLAGCLLGDGYISKRGAICVEQGERQKDYLFWKYNQLKSLVSVRPTKVFRKKSDGNIFSSYRFFLKQYFRIWRRKIYRNGKKVINSELLKLITPLSLAVWYMDDGCKKNNYTLIICTDAFSKNSLKRLRVLLKQKWNISTRTKVKKEGDKSYDRLTIGSYDLVRFIELIRPYIIPSMKYKISDPLTTQSIKRRNRK